MEDINTLNSDLNDYYINLIFTIAFTFAGIVLAIILTIIVIITVYYCWVKEPAEPVVNHNYLKFEDKEKREIAGVDQPRY